MRRRRGVRSLFVRGRLPYKNCSLTHDEQYAQMSLWAIAKSPLMFGGEATALDAFTSRLLSNAAVLDLNAHSTHNRQISVTGSSAVWAASGGTSGSAAGAVYVALFNRVNASAVVSTSLAELGLKSTEDYDALDLWSGGTSVVTGGVVRFHVAAHGVSLLRLLECSRR